MVKNIQVKPFESKTLSWWYNRRSKIDMDPPYQRRGRLWSDADKAYLIDSILNGYDIPKLYIADFTYGDSKLNRKKLPYAIIDGKQRLEAIFEFYEGKIVLNDDFVYLEDPQLKLGGLGYKDLKSNYNEIAENFETYNLSVMSVIASNKELINELFVRLNRSKPLTGAEVRNAMAGRAPEVIRQIAKHELFTTNVRFEVKRAQDLNAAAKLLSFEYYSGFVNTKKKDLDGFVRDSQRKPRTKLELAGRYVLDNLSEMSNIFLPKDKLLNSSGIVPVYYWFIKTTEESYYPYIRKFLVWFEKQRRTNRELVKKQPESKKIKIALVEYDNYNRSTNNEQSHKERVRILNDLFKDWRLSRPSEQ